MTVPKKASQYGMPACTMDQAMKVDSVAISPCAKFTWWVAW